MLILYFIESEYKCPVYDDSNLVRTLDSFAYIFDVARAHNASRRGSGELDCRIGLVHLEESHQFRRKLVLHQYTTAFRGSV